MPRKRELAGEQSLTDLAQALAERDQHLGVMWCRSRRLCSR
jgi:hypothetical protein